MSQERTFLQTKSYMDREVHPGTQESGRGLQGKLPTPDRRRQAQVQKQAPGLFYSLSDGRRETKAASSSKSHSESWGEGRRRHGGRRQGKRPQEFWALFLQQLGAQQIQPTEAPKEASHRGVPQGWSQLQAGWIFRLRTASPQDFPLPLPTTSLAAETNFPRLSPVQRPSASLLQPVLSTAGLHTEVCRLSPHPLPPQAPEKSLHPLSRSLL